MLIIKGGLLGNLLKYLWGMQERKNISFFAYYVALLKTIF